MARLHGNFTPRRSAEPCSLPATPHRLNTAARSDCDYKGVSPRLCVVARKLPNLLHGSVFSLAPFERSWRTVRTARHKRKVSVCLMLHGNYPPGFLCQRADYPVWKGGHMGSARPQFRSKARIEIISFASSRLRSSSST